MAQRIESVCLNDRRGKIPSACIGDVDDVLDREELTVEMLTLEPRASDDETLESEASIGTADSSENLNVDSEETTSDFSGNSFKLIVAVQNFLIRAQ